MIVSARSGGSAPPPAAALATAAAAIESVIGVDPPEPDTLCGELLAGLIPHVNGARWASLTQQQSHSRFVTVGATDDLARRLDQLQYALGDGPCLRAITGVVVAADEAGLREAWPEFAGHVIAETPVRSVLSRPLAKGFGSLNIYSDRPSGLDVSVMLASAGVAVACGLALAAVQQRARADNLAVALESSRRIAAATGVIMASRRIPYDQAFDLLRTASQNRQRKLRDLADEVLYTGTLSA